MATALSVALTTARAYLNDVPGAVWADAQLIPMAQEAHRELQTQLWVVGSPVVRAQTAAITVSAGAVDLGGNQPADLLTPFRMVEYGTSETIDKSTEVTEVTFIPQEAQQATLQYWCWIDEKITFLGATTDRKVVIFYRKLIPIPAATTDPIGILFGELYIGARVAAIGHGSLGNKVAFDALSATAKTNFNLVVMSQRGQQSPGVRP